MTDDLLETLQADVFAVLRNTPALALANVLLNDAETTDSKIENALKTLTTTGGKRGLALVVLRPEITEGEKNLPGPPLTLRIEIQCVEHPLMNRGSDGTGVRSSQAALNALAALHLRHLGHCLLYADKDPIKAVQVKTGYVSDAVTIFAKFYGISMAKPLGVEPVMVTVPTIVISGATGGNGKILGGEADEDGRRSWDGNGVEVGYSGLDGKWIIYGPTWTAEKVSAALTPVGLTGWTVTDGPTTQPVIAAGPETVTFRLTCASPSSTIRYTQDGSYPSPTTTLYSAPLYDIPGGTVFRTAAYVPGQAPGDVLEFKITA